MTTWLLGARNNQRDDREAIRAHPPPGGGIMADEAFLQKTYEARDRFVATLGEVNPDVLAPVMNPALMGGPRWPDLRQAWRVVRKGKNTLVVSDGLADPFSDSPEPDAGFGLEVLAETPDTILGEVPASWLFDLVYLVSQQCAAHGGVAELIDELGLLSLELPMTNVYPGVQDPDVAAGVMLGLPAPGIPRTFALPGGPVLVLTAKLLWPSELEYAATKGAAGRQDLADRFAADGTHHTSSLSRKPVV